MSEPLYRIKPLVWPCDHFAVTSFGQYAIRELECEWWWNFNNHSTGGSADSLESARAACESHWRQRIEAALERVVEGT